MLEFLKKGALAVLIVLVYFFGIREVRKELHDFYMGTALPQEYGEINENYSFHSQSSVSFTICTKQDTQTKGWRFRMPFDSYWLFGTFVLILIGAEKKEYILISSIHLMSGVITTIFVVVGLTGMDIFLIMTDFICRYLIPLASMGYVALVLAEKKSNSHFHVKAS